MDLAFKEFGENEISVINGKPNYNGVSYSRMRTARLSRAKHIATHNKSEWVAMLEFFNYKCLKCGSEIGVTKDHIIPIYQGGTNSIRNIQPLCFSCNASIGPEITDYRESYCNEHGIIMPEKWRI